LTVRTEEPEHSQESYLIGGMIGLLALLLAFSFSIALDRFDERAVFAKVKAEYARLLSEKGLSDAAGSSLTQERLGV